MKLLLMENMRLASAAPPATAATAAGGTPGAAAGIAGDDEGDEVAPKGATAAVGVAGGEGLGHGSPLAGELDLAGRVPPSLEAAGGPGQVSGLPSCSVGFIGVTCFAELGKVFSGVLC